MKFTPDPYIIFHLSVFFLRKYLELLHTGQLLVVFYLQTVDELVHIYFSTVIWFLHPINALRETKAYVDNRKQEGHILTRCPVMNWFKDKALDFSARLNAVPLRAQQTEAAVRDFFGSIDIKHLRERVSKVPKTFFPFLSGCDEDGDTESSEVHEDSAKWYHFWSWENAKNSTLFAKFRTKKPSEPEVASIYSTPDRRQSRPISKSDKFEEPPESEKHSVVEDEAVPRPSSNDDVDTRSKASESHTAQTFLDLKTLWSDHRKRRKPH
ncbi:hypothetical protein JCM33374_g6228 [Metschnikowia sp. JCM 33374]|nr:hypothetical protein JCM33374_g6228 [Metschnikowia sp. JCM 33374]